MADKPVSLARMGAKPAMKAAPKGAKPSGKTHPHANLGKWLHPPKGGKC